MSTAALHRVRADAPADRPFIEPVPLEDWPSSRKRPPFGQRTSRALTRFLITFCIGIAATLTWQSYGDAARQMAADSSPVLGWLAPPAHPLAQAASDQVASAEPALPSADLRQLQAMPVDLSAVRQSMDQLAAQYQQIVGDIATMQAAQQVILHKISAPTPPAPRQAPSPARNPVQN